MISVTARAVLLAAAAWPIASPSPKLCTPIPTAMRSASRLPGREVVDPAPRSELVDRGRAGTDHRRTRGSTRAPASTPSSRRGSSDRPRNPTAPSTDEPANRPQSLPVERRVDRVDGAVMHVPEEEEEDPRRERREPGARDRAETESSAPTGRPRKIVAPAITPSRSMCRVDMWWLATPRVRQPLHAGRGNIAGCPHPATQSTSTSRRSTSSPSRSASTRRTVPALPRSRRASPRCSMSRARRPGRCSSASRRKG